MEDNKNIVIYENDGTEVEILFDSDKETIWLTQEDIGNLFEKKQQTISEHINNIYKTDELSQDRTHRNFRMVRMEGNREVSRDVSHYNLDMIISIGYRVNSIKATKFRQWATKTLKSYLVDGYALNKKRLEEQEKVKFDELQGVIKLMKESLDTDLFEGREKDLFTLIEDYAHTWDTFHRYDEDRLDPEELHNDLKYKLSYSDTRKVVEEMQRQFQKRNITNDLFGQESGDAVKGIIEGINQSFDNQEIYPSIEEKAAHILYLVIKDHPFIDGNKRIGSALFVYFLEHNEFSWKANNEKKINDNALVALALLVASSDPQDKDIMIKLIIRLIQNDYTGS